MRIRSILGLLRGREGAQEQGFQNLWMKSRRCGLRL
ncbi:hypothetical protein LEMLEM_LOCUS10840 [Lemmus lemmus]